MASSVTVRASGRELLRRASIEAREGEVVGLFGPSGAGKTTLFRVLVGELSPNEGAVTLSGEDVTRWPLWQRARRGLGYVPQTPSVLVDLSVRENLTVFAKIARSSRGDVDPNPMGMAEALGLGELMSARASTLSGGERRRLELARALLAKPRVLICDEPFAAVDPLGAQRVGDVLRKVADSGAAVIVSDHHVDVALGVCDKAVLLVEGEVVTAGTPEEFRANPVALKRYLG